MGFEAGKPQVRNGVKARSSKETIRCLEAAVGPYFGTGCSPKAWPEPWATLPPPKWPQHRSADKALGENRFSDHPNKILPKLGRGGGD